MSGNESSARECYQVVMDGETPFSAPYTDRSEAERSAKEFEQEMPDRSFQVESWPNHRQQDTGNQQEKRS